MSCHRSTWSVIARSGALALGLAGARRALAGARDELRRRGVGAGLDRPGTGGT